MGQRGMEPPNIGGGAGGGIAGTRARLGQCPGGAGANALASDSALWEQDAKLKAARAKAVEKVTNKGWVAIEDATADAGANASSKLSASADVVAVGTVPAGSSQEAAPPAGETPAASAGLAA